MMHASFKNGGVTGCFPSSTHYNCSNCYFNCFSSNENLYERLEKLQKENEELKKRLKPKEAPPKFTKVYVWDGERPPYPVIRRSAGRLGVGGCLLTLNEKIDGGAIDDGHYSHWQHWEALE